MPDQGATDPMAAVDLTNFDREPIHALGRVQDYGCLIAVSSDWMITHASQNCLPVLGLSCDDILGTRFTDVFPDKTVHDLRAKMQVLSFPEGHARAFANPLFADTRLFDISVQRNDGHILFEFERRADEVPGPLDDGANQALSARVQPHQTVEKMAAEAARGLKVLCGVQRVLVYRFEDDDSGTVTAEAKEPDMKAFLGLSYPASGIPKQAHSLYTRVQPVSEGVGSARTQRKRARANG